MSIEPFEWTTERSGRRHPPEIQLLEIRSRDNPDGGREPCAWVLVQRVERYICAPGSKEVTEASITVFYQAVETRVGPRERIAGTFSASYSQRVNCISLTGLSPEGRGAIDVAGALRGMRLGTYLLNTIVGWAKQWPAAIVNDIELSEVDGYSANKMRRNHLYEQFGLVFDYADADCRSGKSWPMPAGKLHQVTTWQDNIAEHQVDVCLGKLLQENSDLRADIEGRDRAIGDLNAILKKHEDQPFRTLLATLWAAYARWLVALFVILAIAGSLYHAKR